MHFTKLIILVALSLLIQGCTTNFSPATPMPSAFLDETRTIKRIALGSCFDPGRNDSIFAEVARTDPDLFIFLGDNVYAESEVDDPALMSLRQAYANLAASDSFSELRRQMPVLPIWDDHDYGLDDAGGDWPHKSLSEALYEFAWNIDSGDPVANRPGVHYSKILGEAGKRVQIILLDTRFFRSSLTPNTIDDSSRYLESTEPDQQVLGNDQWDWLAQQLKQPAELRILVSTLMLLSENHSLESWQMLPREKQKLFDVLKDTRAEGVVIASGDSHAAGLYRSDDKIGYPLLELNASSLNVPVTLFVSEPTFPAEPHRQGQPFTASNFGLIDVNWDTGQLDLKIVDEQGLTVMSESISLTALSY